MTTFIGRLDQAMQGYGIECSDTEVTLLRARLLFWVAQCDATLAARANARKGGWGHYALQSEGEEPETVDLQDFIHDNEFPEDLILALHALKPGESFEDGGGASPAWKLTRIA